MGQCFGGVEVKNDGDRNEKEKSSKPGKSRMDEVSQDEKVILKMKIQKDRLTSRAKEMERKQAAAEAEIKQLLKDGKKDQAKFKLHQKKMVKDQQKNYRQKENFIDEQIFRIEKAKDDVEFTNVVKDSNTVLQDLMEKIDIEEIETAKMLQEESQMVREQMNEQLQDDEDDEMDEELKRLEAEMLGNNLDIDVKVDVEVNANTNSQKGSQRQAQLA